MGDELSVVCCGPGALTRRRFLRGGGTPPTRNLDHAQLFAEGGEAGEELAAGGGDHAAAVEDEFVVSADDIDVDDGAAAGAGGVGDESEADVFLRAVPGAGREIQEEIELAGAQRFDRIDVVETARSDRVVRPDIFADGETDTLAVELHDGGFLGGFEITVFVKDVVGREEAFAGGGGDAALFAKRGAIESGATLAGSVGLDGAEYGGDNADLGGDFAGGLLNIRDEAALKKQIAGWVAADDEFREDDEFRALGDEGVIGVENPPAIAGQVADRGVELGYAEAHDLGLGRVIEAGSIQLLTAWFFEG